MSLVFAEATCRFSPAGSAALDRLTLEAAPGQLTCLAGPNGAGKSTALAAAAGLLHLASGSIAYRDRRIDPARPAAAAGYLPQHSSFPRALRVGEILDFHISIRAMPEPARRESTSLFGLEEKLRQPVGTLSTGWVRRLGLAVALLPASELLLLDEPFVGLDLEVLDTLAAELARRAREGATVLIASHDFDVVDSLGARVAVLDCGRLVAESAGAPPRGARDFYRKSLGKETELRAVGT